LKAIGPPCTHPGGWTSRKIDNAVIDFPLPDSPTMPNVSPRRRSKLTWSTARTIVERNLKVVLKSSTRRSG
jgi:hypothetical protein